MEGWGLQQCTFSYVLVCLACVLVSSVCTSLSYVELVFCTRDFDLAGPPALPWSENPIKHCFLAFVALNSQFRQRPL